MTRVLGVALLLAAFFSLFSDRDRAMAAGEFETRRLAEKLEVDGRQLPFQLGSLFLMPGESVTIDTGDVGNVLRTSAGELRHVGGGRWRLTPPAMPGADFRLAVRRADGSKVAQLNVFVLVPATQIVDGKIGDYIIGDYPDPAGIDAPADYTRPRGFVKVTEKNRKRRLSPHFSLRQFLAKQESDWPKYIVPEPALYERLEQLLHAVNQNFAPSETLTIMSGYRTPHYNQSIGQVAYSRHVYGDAADVYVDNDGDGTMDDLNADGVVDRKDAELLASWIDFPIEPVPDEADGGIGIYKAAAWRGPFVHVDTRGYRARW